MYFNLTNSVDYGKLSFAPSEVSVTGRVFFDNVTDNAEIKMFVYLLAEHLTGTGFSLCVTLPHVYRKL